MMRRRSALVFLIAAVSLLETSCYSVTVFPGGYRREGVWLPKKRQIPYKPHDRIRVAGHDLRFEDTLGVYVVVDHDGCYYVGGQFYCRLDEGWGVGAGLDGPWTAVPETRLPPGLRQSDEVDGKVDDDDHEASSTYIESGSRSKVSMRYS